MSKQALTITASTEMLVPSKMTALAAGAGVELVLKVRQGKRGTGPKAKRVAMADELLQEGMSRLLGEVQQRVKSL